MEYWREWWWPYDVVDVVTVDDPDGHQPSEADYDEAALAGA